MLKRLFTAVLISVMVFSMNVFAADLPEGVPSSLEAPAISNLELQKTDDGTPYFRLEFTVPQSILDLDIERPTDGWTNIEIDGKIDNSEWGATGGGGGHLDSFATEETAVPGKANTYYMTLDLEDEGTMTETVINSRVYTYRVRFSYTYIWGDGPGEFDDLSSSWSNELASKSTAFYSGASSWAVTELDKAQEYGLITDRIKNNMSGKVTREEFAEIAVKLYEAYTGTKATAGTSSFTDTTNPEILKAANLGLVQGVGNNQYAPDRLVTREQMATILLRALKVLNPAEDYSIAGTAAFADDKQLESYARDGVYYCAKAKIVTGVGNNMFSPKGDATREMAVIVCTRAYEYFSK